MERRLMRPGDYAAEVSFDSEDGLFRARVVNLERDSFDFCASSIDELHQEFARSVSSTRRSAASEAASRRSRGRSPNNL